MTTPLEKAINFLISIPEGSTETENVANLLRDAKLYKWGAATIAVIAAGIVAHKHDGKAGIADVITSLESELEAN